MFLRASRRHILYDAIPQCPANELQLPFLCPILFVTKSRSRKAFRHTSLWSRPHPKQLHLGSVSINPDYSQPQRRSHAHAAVVDGPVDDGFVPFNHGDLSSRPPDHRPSSPVYDPRSFDLSGFDATPSPLIINSMPKTTPGKFRATNAISGDINEIHQTLHACLQVGRLERASALVRRLRQIYKPDAAGLLAAHNDYIREITNRIIQGADESLLKKLRTWFERDMRSQGVAPDATTFALMIQSCRPDPNRNRAERAIRRYQDLAKAASLGEQVRALTLDSDNIDDREPIDHDAFKDVVQNEETERASVGIPSMDASPAEISEVRSVNQKGAGLSTLQRSLSIFNSERASAADTITNPETDVDSGSLSAQRRQQLLERNTLEAAISRWQDESAHLQSLGVNNSLSNFTVGSMMWEWHGKLVDAIRGELQKADQAESKEKRTRVDEDRLLWAPFMHTLSPEKLSAVTILSCMKVVAASPSDSSDSLLRLISVLVSIGEIVRDESFAEAIRKNPSYSKLRNPNHNGGIRSHPKTLARQRNVNSRAEKASTAGAVSRAYENMDWSLALKTRIGAVLFSLISDIAKIEVCRHDPNTDTILRENQPVFFHAYQYHGGKRLGVIRINAAMTEKMSQTPVRSAIAKHLPMIAEPRPWVGFREGGFLEHSVGAVRLKSGERFSKRYAMTAAENGDMAQVFQGLDALAKTPWKINRGIFKVMLDAWNSGEAIAKIPPLNVEIERPPEPSASDGPRIRQEWMRKSKSIENYKAGLKSQRCFQNFQMEVARAYLDEIFYFPHNVDFRGRAYPMAPFLNHMGADNARGLMTFAHGKRLGTNGLRWLKIHLANLYGYDKATLGDRVSFVDEHMPQIYDAAVNPLTGSRWWLKAEDPWQCLAVCMELKAAHDLPDPTGFVSNVPVHQDGTCNGLQHYAALGGDVVGAKQVNLEPGERPSDVYTAVAGLVQEDMKKDAAEGIPLACLLEKHVTRKVVKQTVMTNVYGVTLIGAIDQVHKQLENLQHLPDFREVDLRAASRYVTRKIFKVLAKMFNGAHDIQYWFSDCAGRISESLSPDQIAGIKKEAEGEYPPSPYKLKQLKNRETKDALTSFTTPVIWTTPLKMPVVQPYRKEGSTRVTTGLQIFILSNPSATSPIDKAKQIQAFPPNFIHSLDGTHMFLTALRCREMGLTFAAVHDSFWTHAGDVDTMNSITRDAFIRMHSESIIARLAAEFEVRYKGFMHLASVKHGSSVAHKIKVWRKARGTRLSKEHWRDDWTAESKNAELLLEVRRQELLASDNATELDEGAKMITPASIYLEEVDNKDFVVTEHQPAALGGINLRHTKLRANEELQVGDLNNAEIVEPRASSTADSEVESESERAEVEAGMPAPPEDAMGGSSQPESSQAQKPKTRGGQKVRLWLPLTFPPVPKKGDFDVSRLKDSLYFFS